MWLIRSFSFFRHFRQVHGEPGGAAMKYSCSCCLFDGGIIRLSIQLVKHVNGHRPLAELWGSGGVVVVDRVVSEAGLVVLG